MKIIPKQSGTDAMLTKADLKSRGWTDRMITQLVTIPDAIKPNQRYRSAAPMKLYLRSRVAAVELTEEFAAIRAASANRRTGAAKAVKTKRDALLAHVDGLVIEVPSLPLDELVRLACESYNRHKDEMALDRERDENELMATPTSNPEFLDRICVNYLRHQMTSYEAQLRMIARRVGTRDAYLDLRSKIFDVISDTYPDLSNECWKQQEEAEFRAMSDDR